MPENSILLRTKSAVLGLSRCGPLAAGTDAVESEDQFTVVLPLAGLFVVDVEGRQATATPAKLVLFSKGQTHRIRHPRGGLDRSAFITMKSETAQPALDRRGEFPVLSWRTTAAVDFELRQLLRQARRGRLGSLQLEEFISGLLDLVVHSDGVEVRSTEGRRALVAAAEEYLSVSFREHADLASIAKELGTSPHHLSRWFRRLTGESMSRRRMRLRLGFALDQVVGGAEDLSMVAVESGFYDHAHLTNSFRAHFGTTPEAARSGSARRCDGLPGGEA